jgi:hypothetical protein
VGGHPRATGLLFVAWIFWGVSCATVLYSHFSSVVAHNEAITAFDKNGEPDIAANKLTKILNALSGTLFVLGLLVFGFFAYINLSK